MLAAKGISGVPIVDDDGAVVGVLSEADVLVKAGGEPARGRFAWFMEPDFDLRDKIAATTAGEAMSAPAITIGPERPVHEAAARWCPSPSTGFLSSRRT